MSSLNSQNRTLVHPPFFFITGLIDVPHAKYYYIFLSFVFVVSVLGNSFVMFILYTERSFHTPKYMAVFNLAVADLGESIALIPNTIAMFLFDSQYISFNACLAHMFFAYFFTLLQCLTLAVLACDRLVAICLPLRYHAIITMPAMVAMLTAVWAYMSVSLMVMVAFITRLSFCKSIVVKGFFCDHRLIYQLACNDNSYSINIAIFHLTFSICVPFSFIVLSYAFIVHALFKIASWEGRCKAIKTCSAHLMLVAIYFLPLLSTYIAVNFVTIHPNARLMNTSLAKAITPMLNPIIYVLSTEEVKEASKKKFSGKNWHRKNKQLELRNVFILRELCKSSHTASFSISNFLLYYRNRWKLRIG